MAEEIRHRVREETRLTCSCGIGPNRLLAKVPQPPTVSCSTTDPLRSGKRRRGGSGCRREMLCFARCRWLLTCGSQMGNMQSWVNTAPSAALWTRYPSARSPALARSVMRLHATIIRLLLSASEPESGLGLAVWHLLGACSCGPAECFLSTPVHVCQQSLPRIQAFWGEKRHIAELQRWGLHRCRSRCSVRSVLRCVRTWWPSGGCLQRSSRPSRSTSSWRLVRQTLRHISVRVSCLHILLLGCRGMSKLHHVSFLPHDDKAIRRCIQRHEATVAIQTRGRFPETRLNIYV